MGTTVHGHWDLHSQLELGGLLVALCLVDWPMLRATRAARLLARRASWF